MLLVHTKKWVSFIQSENDSDAMGVGETAESTDRYFAWEVLELGLSPDVSNRSSIRLRKTVIKLWSALWKIMKDPAISII